MIKKQHVSYNWEQGQQPDFQQNLKWLWNDGVVFRWKNMTLPLSQTRDEWLQRESVQSQQVMTALLGSFIQIFAAVYTDTRWSKMRHTNAAQNEWHLELAPEHLSPHAFLFSPPSYYWWTLTAHKSKSNFFFNVYSTLHSLGQEDICAKIRHVKTDMQSRGCYYFLIFILNNIY